MVDDEPRECPVKGMYWMASMDIGGYSVNGVGSTFDARAQLGFRRTIAAVVRAAVEDVSILDIAPIGIYGTMLEGFRHLIEFKGREKMPCTLADPRGCRPAAVTVRFEVFKRLNGLEDGGTLDKDITDGGLGVKTCTSECPAELNRKMPLVHRPFFNGSATKHTGAAISQSYHRVTTAAPKTIAGSDGEAVNINAERAKFVKKDDTRVTTSPPMPPSITTMNATNSSEGGTDAVNIATSLMGLTADDFGAAEKATFANTIAAETGVSKSQVVVKSVAAHKGESRRRRRLLGISEAGSEGEDTAGSEGEAGSEAPKFAIKAVVTYGGITADLLTQKPAAKNALKSALAATMNVKADHVKIKSVKVRGVRSCGGVCFCV